MQTNRSHFASPALVKLTELFTAFFHVGLTSFGMAILQNLREMSLRRGFVTPAELAEGVALVQMYPGPIMVNLVAFIGYRRRGPVGALVSVLGFLLPATMLMLALSEAYRRWGELPAVAAFIPGLTAIVVGVIIHVTTDLGRNNIGTPRDALLALLAFAIGATGGNMMWAVAIGAVLGAAGWKTFPDDGVARVGTPVAWRRLGIPLMLGLGLIALAMMLRFESGSSGALARVFMQIGAVAFGNGATILPIMQQAVVETHGWLTDAQFAAAIAFGQVTPGPILNSATFVGYMVDGLRGGLVATAAIFAPSVAMTMIFTELFVHVRHLAAVRGAVRGIMAVFVGMLGWVIVSLGQQLLHRPAAWLLITATLFLLHRWQWSVLKVFGAGLLLWEMLIWTGL